MEQEPVPPPAIDGGTIDDEQTRDASDGDPAEAPVDLAALAALPHRVLRDAELDLLELALGGGVRSGEPVPWQAGEVMTRHILAFSVLNEPQRQSSDPSSARWPVTVSPPKRMISVPRSPS